MKQAIIKLTLPAKDFLLTIFVLGVIADWFFIPGISTLRFILLFLLWLLIILTYHLKSSSTFFVALCMAGLLIVLYIFIHEGHLVKKIANWIFLMLLFGTFQQYLEIRS